MRECFHCGITGERMQPVAGLRGEYECVFTKRCEQRILAKMAIEQRCVYCGAADPLGGLEHASDVPGYKFQCCHVTSCQGRIARQPA